MRRKQKHIITGTAIGAAAFAVVDIIMQCFELKEAGKQISWQNYNGKRTFKQLLKGGVVGGLTGYLRYKYIIWEESKHPFNADQYLNKIISGHNIMNNPALYDRLVQKREKIRIFLMKHFGGLLAGQPEDVGSLYRRTAINTNYDADLIVPFHKGGSSLEEIYHLVYEALDTRFGNEAEITKQTKSIGITFSDDDDNIIHLDIVPGREINNYPTDKDLHFYTNPSSLSLWEQGSYVKTNVDKHKKLLIRKPSARRIVKLLKIYRDRNGFNIPSILIEQLVADAFNKGQYVFNNSDSNNLLNCMDYLARKIVNKQVLDIANSNNDISRRMSDYEKDEISDQLIRDIERVEENKGYWREIFE